MILVWLSLGGCYDVKGEGGRLGMILALRWRFGKTKRGGTRAKCALLWHWVVWLSKMVMASR